MKVLAKSEVLPMDSLLAFGSKLFAMILIFIAPIQAAMAAVGFLIMADLFTGIWAAKKRGEKITSNGLRNTISKMLAYPLCIITAHVTQSYLVPDLPIYQVTLAMIGLVEVKSFFENITHITGIDIWEEVLKKIHGNKKLPPKSRR